MAFNRKVKHMFTFLKKIVGGAKGESCHTGKMDCGSKKAEAKKQEMAGGCCGHDHHHGHHHEEDNTAPKGSCH